MSVLHNCGYGFDDQFVIIRRSRPFNRNLDNAIRGQFFFGGDVGGVFRSYMVFNGAFASQCLDGVSRALYPIV